MGFYVRYVAFVLNLLSRTWIGLQYPALSYPKVMVTGDILGEKPPPNWHTAK